MNTCSPPLQFFVCTANGFYGCCDYNPCGESQPICRYTTTVCSNTIGTVVTLALLAAASGISAPTGSTSNIHLAPATQTGLPSVVLSESWLPSSGYSGTQNSASTRPTGVSIIGVVVTPISTGTMSTFSTVAMSLASSAEATFNSSNGTTSLFSSSTKGAVAGSVVGGIAAIAFIAGLATLFMKRRRMRLRKESEEAQKKEKFVIATQFEIPPTDGEETRSITAER